MEIFKDSWSKQELEEVFSLYEEVKFSIHKHNKLIIELANKLNKKTRGVENQLLMFRAVEREIKTNDTYGRKNYNKLIKEIYLEKMNKMEVIESVQSTNLNSIDYPYRFKNFVKTNEGAVRKSNDHESGRPIGVMINLPIHKFISRVIKLNDVAHKILFLIGGPGNGKTDATDFAFDEFIKYHQLDNFKRDTIKSEYINNFTINDNYYSHCNVDENFFFCIQDATVRMHSNTNNFEAFLHVYKKFKSTTAGVLLVCINRGVLHDFLNKSKEVSELEYLMRQVEGSSNLESYFNNTNNFNIICEHLDFICSLSTYPLDKSSLFSTDSSVHKDVCSCIVNSKWSTDDIENFNIQYFQDITNNLSELINLYEIKNNKKVTFREYYHWLHVLFTPYLIKLSVLKDSPLLRLWKLATTQSINTVFTLINQLQDPNLKKDLNPLLSDLRILNGMIEQNKSLNSIQEFHPNLLSQVWDTEKIYTLITIIRDELQYTNQKEKKSSIDFEYYSLTKISESEKTQLFNLVELYSRVDNHILDTKTKEIEKIRKFLLILIRNYLCAIDFRISGIYNYKKELDLFRKLDSSDSKQIQETLRKLLRIRDDGSGYFKMKVALNNNIWEYSFTSENVIDGEIDNIEKAFDFKKISFLDKPPIEIKLFVSKFIDGQDIVTFIDFGTFLNILDSASLFNTELKRISSTISPNFKLWLNSEAEKFVSGRFHEIDSITIPKIARINRRNNNRISVENYESL